MKVKQYILLYNFQLFIIEYIQFILNFMDINQNQANKAQVDVNQASTAQIQSTTTNLEQVSQQLAAPEPSAEPTLQASVVVPSQSNEVILNSNQVIDIEKAQEKNGVHHMKDMLVDDSGPMAHDEIIDHDLLHTHHINANVLQMAIINKMLPKGYKFELLETVQRMMEANKKRNAGLANYQIKKPEIQNEKKMQRILHKYQQKKIREQQKLEEKQTLLMSDKDRLMRQEAQSNQVRNQRNDAKNQNSKMANDQLDQDSAYPQKQDGKARAKNKKDQNGILENQSKNGDQYQNSKFDQLKNDSMAKNRANGSMFDTDGKDNLRANGMTDGPYDRSKMRAQNPQDKKNLENENQSKQAADHLMKEEDTGKNGKNRKRHLPKNRANQQDIELESQNQSYDNQGDNDGDRSYNNLGGRNGDGNRKDQRFLQGGSALAPQDKYQTKVFTKIEPNKFKIFDKYHMILESMINHPDLEAYIQAHKQQPLFLRVPSSSLNNYEQLQKENDGEGFLNFQMIQQRMKNKKYGPGKSIQKETILLANIRNIFRNSDKYFSHDDGSVRVARILEQHFENELAVSPIPKNYQRQLKKQLGAEDNEISKNQKNDERGPYNRRKQSSIDDDMNNQSDENEHIRSVSSKSKKKKDKRDKKRDKKDKKKKNKDKDHKKDHDMMKSSHNNRGNSDDQNSDDEDEDSQFEMKQQLFEIITTRLTIEQKKGIIPIVFQNNNGNKKQKFEFDLFSLEPKIFKKLEEYVQNCLSTNHSGSAGAQKQENSNQQQEKEVKQNEPVKNHGINDQSDDIQNQINEKLRENKMSLDTEINEGQNYQANNNQDVVAEAAQPQTAAPPTTARKLYNLEDTTSKYLEDRYLLIEKINKLENKQLRGIVPIVKPQKNTADGQNNDDNQKLEFDLYELSDQKCKELHNYIEMCLQQNDENKQKEENQRNMDQQIRMMMQDNNRNIRMMMDKQMGSAVDQNPQNGTAEFQPQHAIGDPQNSNEVMPNATILQDASNTGANQFDPNVPNENANQKQMMFTNQINGQNSVNDANAISQPQQQMLLNQDQQEQIVNQGIINGGSQDQQDQQKAYLIQKLDQIQQINVQGTKLINYMASKQEFLQLANNSGTSASGQDKSVQFDPSTGNLLLRSLSLDQLVYLISVFQSDELQQKYIQLMLKDEKLVVGSKLGQDGQLSNQIKDENDEKFANYNPELYPQQEQQLLLQIQQLQSEYNTNQASFNNHLQEQFTQLQQNQLLTQQLTASLQDPSNSHFQGVSVSDLQNTLQQTVSNEQILDQNIKNINAYLEQQTQEYNSKKQAVEEQLQQIRQLFKEYSEWIQKKQLGIGVQPQNNDDVAGQQMTMLAMAQQQPEGMQMQMGLNQNSNKNDYNNQLNQGAAINTDQNQNNIQEMPDKQGNPMHVAQATISPQDQQADLNQGGVPQAGNTIQSPDDKLQEKPKAKRGRKPKPKPDQVAGADPQAAQNSVGGPQQANANKQKPGPKAKNQNAKGKGQNTKQNAQQPQQDMQNPLGQPQQMPETQMQQQQQQPQQMQLQQAQIPHQTNINDANAQVQQQPQPDYQTNLQTNMIDGNQLIDQMQVQQLGDNQMNNQEQQQNNQQQQIDIEQQIQQQQQLQQQQSQLVMAADGEQVQQIDAMNHQLQQNNQQATHMLLQSNDQQPQNTMNQIENPVELQQDVANVAEPIMSNIQQQQQIAPNPNMPELQQNNQQNLNNDPNFQQPMMQTQLDMQAQQQQQQNVQVAQGQVPQQQADGAQDIEQLKQQMIFAIDLYNQNNEQLEQRIHYQNQMSQLSQNLQAALQEFNQIQEPNEQLQQQKQDYMNQLNQVQEEIMQSQNEINQYKLQQEQINQQLQALQLQVNQGGQPSAQEDIVQASQQQAMDVNLQPQQVQSHQPTQAMVMPNGQLDMDKVDQHQQLAQMPQQVVPSGANGQQFHMQYAANMPTQNQQM